MAGTTPYSAPPAVMCHHCNMMFSSVSQLSLHKQKFCVGATHARRFVDPYDVLERNVWLADEKIQQLRSLKEENLRKSRDTDRYERTLISDDNSQPVKRDFAFRDSRFEKFPDKQLQKQLQNQVNALSDKYTKSLLALRSEKDNLRVAQADLENRLTNVRYTDVPYQISPRFDPLADDSDISDVDDLTYSKQRPQPPALKFQFGGGSLVAEISALRQHYISSGGVDPTVLRQLNDMLQEAEDMTHQAPQRYHPGKKDKHIDPAILALESENLKLQRELASYEKKPSIDREYEQSAERKYFLKLLELEKEVKLLKFKSSLQQQQQQSATQQPSNKAGVTYYQKISAISSPSSYDKTHGFACFYDFVTGLEATARVCKVVVSIYNSQRELGTPSVLPVIVTEDTELGRSAIIGAKQPFPNCPSSKDMSLLIEVQTARSNSEEFTSKAWTKIDLFLSTQLLNSGAWKVPLHAMPLRLNLSCQDLERMPVYESSMIYLRLTNHIDTGIQSNLPISPANHVDYSFPPNTNW